MQETIHVVFDENELSTEARNLVDLINQFVETNLSYESEDEINVNKRITSHPNQRY